MNKKCVCGVVVTFHPLPEDIVNLSILRPQVEGMVVVDNGSTGANLERLREASGEAHFELIENGENLGLAEGLNLGAKWARSQGFEWVMFFDQDSAVTPGLVDTMMREFTTHPLREQVALIVPRYVDRRTGRILPARYNGDGTLKFAMTSGSLMPLSLLEEQGWFEVGLFIGGIDFDYSLRVQCAGYKLLECKDAVLLHAPSSPRVHRLFGATIFMTSNYGAIRRYYSERNRVWLRRKYIGKFPAICLELYWSSLKEAIKVIIGEEDKWQKIRYIVWGMLDGWRGRKGRNDDL